MIYLDSCATTPLDPRVLEKMLRIASECFGNPSSIHTEGRRAARVLAEARATIAASIHARPSEIVFTSGGTEANNLVISSAVQQGARNARVRLVTTTVEHASVRNRMAWERRSNPERVEILEVPVTSSGLIDEDHLQRLVTPETLLLSVLHCNNETGVLQKLSPLFELRLKNPNLLLHLDIVQSFLKFEFDVRTMPVDFLTASAHKFHGPKGTGFLYVRDGVQVEPLLIGGPQEKFRRAGTENVPAAVGMAEAVSVQPGPGNLREQLDLLETTFLQELTRQEVFFKMNGGGKWPDRMPGIFNITLGAVKNKEDLQIALDLEGVQVSSASACSSGVVKVSHVLRAMGMQERDCVGAIRIGMNRFITEGQARLAADRVAAVVKRLD